MQEGTCGREENWAVFPGPYASNHNTNHYATHTPGILNHLLYPSLLHCDHLQSTQQTSQKQPKNNNPTQ